jgi:hypothetical protein
MVMVSIPRERQRVARELSDGLMGVIRGEGLRHVLVATATLTAVLCIPNLGLIVGGVILVVGAAFYGDVIRRISRADEEAVEPGWLSIVVPRSLLKPVLWVLMAAGTAFPLWGMNSGPNRSPHWSRTGALIAGLSWTILPIAMLLVYGRDRQGRLGVKKCLGVLARHPFATLLALAIVPMTLILTEAALGLVFYLPGNLPYFALEFMPMPGDPAIYKGVPHYTFIDFRSYPQSRFIGGYFNGLRHGYSFSAAIPASLSLPTRAGLNPKIIHSLPIVYDFLRVLLTLAIVSCLITGFAVQAVWLGAIASVEKKRPA